MLVGVREKRLAGDTVKQGQRSCQGCRVEITSETVEKVLRGEF